MLGEVYPQNITKSASCASTTEITRGASSAGGVRSAIGRAGAAAAAHWRHVAGARTGSGPARRQTAPVCGLDGTDTAAAADGGAGARVVTSDHTEVATGLDMGRGGMDYRLGHSHGAGHGLSQN